jgi:two-component system, NtrC family, nitrogen regulation sensor histidine kinase NtrY
LVLDAPPCIAKFKNMVFKRLRVNIALRVGMLILLIISFVFVIHQKQYFVATFLNALFIILTVVELIRYLETLEKKTSQLFLTIQNKDFSTTFPREGSDYPELQQTFDRIVSEIRNIRIEKEQHYQYLQTVIAHISVALLCYDAEGRIQLINDAAKKLIHLRNPQSIQEIRSTNPSLYEGITGIRPGSSELFKLIVNGQLLQLSVSCTEFRLQGNNYRLLSLQNIHNEMEVQELESYQKLIRVLTHEIMNSVTPISSLSTAINEQLIDEAGLIRNTGLIEKEDHADIVSSLRTIEARSKGLLDFVRSYRNLTKIPVPSFTVLKVKELLQHACSLLKKDMDQAQIRLQVFMEKEEMEICADSSLLTQVLINLLVNAIDSIPDERDEKKISILAGYADSRPYIEVTDNGAGIEPENMEKIFVPFFTTRKKGSGIGLSLSRQIMRLHKGSITVRSKPGESTAFTLSF